MSQPQEEQRTVKVPENLIGYFDQQVLAAYRNEPHKYTIESDYFEGSLSVTNEYFLELESAGKAEESVSIQFGYRTLRDGNLAIAAWLPDLFDKSKAHVQRWSAFHLKKPEWTTDQDERFMNWVRRYFEGDWDVDNGPSFYLGQALDVINGLTSELVGIPLYLHKIDGTIGYPSAENTHRYQDAHKELYGYLIDGLNKECISRLASALGRTIKTGDKTTIKALTSLFPYLETAPHFLLAMNLVSEQRRLSSHGVRPAAKKFPAFSQFTADIRMCLDAIKEVLNVLEREFGVNGAEAHDRHETKKWLPEIDRPPQSHYSIVEASRMKGKTIERVEFGFRKEVPGVHGSEALIIYFTDGSIMGIATGSNAGNLSSDENGLRPEDFHVDFRVNWVPELPKDMSKP
ncbi:MAG TPA: hypothetical protein VGK24_07650 [Candidatus Angelobacter sp.]|jgi:hypothetical protein